MKKRTYKCTIESASDGWMIIWFGRTRIEASCSMLSANGETRLNGTVRNGPSAYLARGIEITTTDNENGRMVWQAA